MARESRENTWSQLMLAAIGGDEGAYRNLLSELSSALRPIVGRGFGNISVNGSEVEDITQEVLLAVHLKRHTWDQSKPIGPWILAIARNKMIDYLRKRGRRGEVNVDGLLEQIEAGGHEDAIHVHDVGRVLDNLSGRNREIVQAISIDGYSARDVADRLGMTEVAVRVSLHRSLKSLSDQFGSEKGS